MTFVGWQRKNSHHYLCNQISTDHITMTFFYRYQDKNTSAMIMRSAAGNWLALRGELLSNFLVTSVSAGALFATQSRGEWHFYEFSCLSSREVDRK